jgi:hypothetical protein
VPIVIGSDRCAYGSANRTAHNRAVPATDLIADCRTGTVVLRWIKASSAQFQLSQAEADSAVKKFTSRTGYDFAIFNRVQEALAELEGKASRYPAVS